MIGPPPLDGHEARAGRDAGRLPISAVEQPLGEYIAGAQDRIDQQIGEYLNGIEDGDFKEMFDHALSGETAKRIRPITVYMVGDTFGIDRDQLDGLALATELIHTASQIMDDLPGQDNSGMRRGKESLHARFDVGSAELASIAMLSDAGKIIGTADGQLDLNGRLSSHVWGLIGPDGMAAGQRRDLKLFGKDPDDVSVEELDDITRLKTGTAIEMGILGASLIGRLPQEITDVLQEYSYHGGIAYQVKDDVRDATESSSKTGKTAGLDAANRKPTYFSVMGEEAANAKVMQHAQAAAAALERLPAVYNPVKLRELIEYFALS